MTTNVPRPVVLVVEDDRVNQKLLADICEAEGYEVATADDGESALEVFEQRSIHVVLVDASMPRRDGFEVCRQIRKVSQVPVIMVTASMEPGVELKAQEAGVNAFVPKPFRVYELARHIRSALVAHRSPSEPPTSRRRILRHQAADALSALPGAVDLRLKLRRESDQESERACLVVRLAEERQLSEKEGRHATDAVLGALGRQLITVLGEESVYWSDAAELVGVMPADQLEAALEAAEKAPSRLATAMQLEGVVLWLGAVRYRAAIGNDIELVLQTARAAAEEAETGSKPFVVRELSELGPSSEHRKSE